MMKSQAMWLVSGLWVFTTMAGSVHAGAVVELRLADLTGAPIECPRGGFYAGDQFLVELWLKPDQDIVVREMTIDYRGSDAQLIPSFGLDIDTVNQPIDGVPNFWFDYTGAGFGTYPAEGLVPIKQYPGLFLSSTANYTDFTNLISGSPAAPAPVAMATTDSSPSANLKTFTAGVYGRVGGMPVTMPSIHGAFIVDLLGSPTGEINNRNNGSSITFGFGAQDDPVTIWAAATNDPTVDGSLTYAPGAGPLSICTPEPATILLYTSGVCLLLWNSKKRSSYT